MSHFFWQLEKARESVDLANIRAAYAECTTEVLTNNSKGAYYEVEVKQTTDGWVSSPDKVAGTLDVTSDSVGSKLGGTNKKVFVCVSKDGVLSLNTTAPADSTKLPKKLIKQLLKGLN